VRNDAEPALCDGKATFRRGPFWSRWTSVSFGVIGQHADDFGRLDQAIQHLDALAVEVQELAADNARTRVAKAFEDLMPETARLAREASLQLLKSRFAYLADEYPALLKKIERAIDEAGGLVGAAGLEPATLCLEGKCSIQLSYAPTENKTANPARTATPSTAWQSQADGVHEDSNPNPCSACSAGDWRQEHHKHDYPPSESPYAPDVALDNVGRAWSGEQRVPELDVAFRAVPRRIAGVDLKPGVPRV
jgi:hypothetical protein